MVPYFLHVVFWGILCVVGVSANAPAASDQRQITFIDSEDSFLAVPAIQLDAFAYLASKPKPLSAETTRFIIVRHGQALSNRDNHIAGRTVNSDLTEDGVDQAVQVGKALAHAGIRCDAMYSSPSLRAMHTAKIVADLSGLNADLSLDERLYERFFGPYEGCYVNEYMEIVHAETTWASGLHIPFNEKFSYKFHPDIESYGEMHARIGDFLQTAHQNHRGETVLVGCHGALMKILFVGGMYDQGYEVDYRVFDLNHCGILIVEVDDGGRRVVATKDLVFRH